MGRNDKITFSVSSGFCILAVLAIYFLPFPWLAGWWVAACIHELSHFAVLCICKIRVFSVRIASTGAIIETEQLSLRQEIVTALAGPLGGILLLLFYRYIPYAAVCALIQSSFNLIPIYPMDGGRVAVAIWKLQHPGR